MNRKILISIGLALALMLTLSGTVLAAPAAQETTPITGTVQSITLETDSAGLTTVLVSVLDDTGVTQSVRLSVDDAANQTPPLVTLDPVTGDPLVNDAAVGGPVSIDPAVVIGDEEGEEAQHPVAFVLSEFFDVDYETIMTAHEEGVGFGVIAQALWMSQEVGGDAEMFTTIVEAKKSGDYSAIPLPDGSTPQNWGQFKKAILQKGQNLGSVMSGSAEIEDDLTAESNDNPEKHGPKNKGNHGNGNGNGNGKPK